MSMPASMFALKNAPAAASLKSPNKSDTPGRPPHTAGLVRSEEGDVHQHPGEVGRGCLGYPGILVPHGVEEPAVFQQNQGLGEVPRRNARAFLKAASRASAKFLSGSSQK